MLMRKLVYVVLLIILGGCISPSPSLEDIHQRVAKQVEVLIDSGYLLTTYIEIDEVFSTDSNSLYYIGESDSPGSDGAELPSRVIKYKERYLCFIELDEPEMSRTELFERGFVSDSNFHENLCLNRGRDWLLALRKYEDKHILVKMLPNYYRLFEYPELWSYFSGDIPQEKTALMGLTSHDIIVPSSHIPDLFELEIDSLKNYVERFSGEIFVRNQTDSVLLLSRNSARSMCYAVINGPDTLKLVLRDSLPVAIAPHDFKSLKYDSEPPHSFLQNLPDKDIWMSMYKLFSDSTFCFLNINNIPQKFRIMHNDAVYSSDLRDSLSKRVRYIYNKGVYDKEERIRRFFKWD